MQPCPVCRKRPRNAACGMRVYVSAQCPVCLEESNPVVTLPCGHVLCEMDFVSLGGSLQSASSGSSDDVPELPPRRSRRTGNEAINSVFISESDSDASYVSDLGYDSVHLANHIANQSSPSESVETECYPESDEENVALEVGPEHEGCISETEYYPSYLESDETSLICEGNEFAEETECDSDYDASVIIQEDPYEDDEHQNGEGDLSPALALDDEYESCVYDLGEFEAHLLHTGQGEVTESEWGEYEDAASPETNDEEPNPYWADEEECSTIWEVDVDNEPLEEMVEVEPDSDSYYVSVESWEDGGVFLDFDEHEWDELAIGAD